MTQRDIKRLHKVIDELVISQGNEFVKELLRSKKLPIGITKTNFLLSLHKAIDEKTLTTDDVEEWLSEVEGWGAHHAYLFTFDRAKMATFLSSTTRLSRGLAEAKLAKIHASRKSFSFPTQLSPTVVAVEGGNFEIIWHQGTESWPPDPDMNREEVIEGDQYKFKAFRRRADRNVVRFVVRGDLGVAGIFIGIPLGDDHQAALAVVRAATAAVLGRRMLSPVNIGAAQVKLDNSARTVGRKVSSIRSRLRAPGGYVEFGTTTDDGDYNNVEVIRQVRLAVRDGLTGDSGDFNFEVISERDKMRIVRVKLDANSWRVYIRAQVSATEEWMILDQIAQ